MSNSKIRGCVERPLHVCHLTSAHPRTDSRIYLKECVTLAEAGFRVTLIVADGKGDELVDDVTIIDVGKACGRYARMIGAVGRVRDAAVRQGADLYHIHDPELLRIAKSLRQLKGRERVVIYDAHEDVPRQILSKPWIPLLLRKCVSWGFERIENAIVGGLSGVVAATAHISDRFLVHVQHVIDVKNYPLPDELVPPVDNVRLPNHICYVGAVSENRGLTELVNALPLVPEARLILCGPFQPVEYAHVLKCLPGWAQVDYRGVVGRNEVGQVMSECQAGLVTLRPLPAYVDALPVKMFEYMSAGLAVIASDFALWRNILSEGRSGLCVDPLSSADIAKAIHTLISNPTMASDMGAFGRGAIVERYNWATEARKLVSFYEVLLCQRRDK